MNTRCARCQVDLEEREVKLSYLGSVFSASLPVCPSCGQVFVPEELAEGRIREVEQMLEDK